LERVIRTSANRRGIKVRIRIDNGNVVIQTHQDDEPMRTVTKSPSAKSIRERKAAEPATNGDKPVKTTAKRVVKRAPTQAPSAPAKRRKLVKAPA
jgi:hypothetical protein